MTAHSVKPTARNGHSTDKRDRILDAAVRVFAQEGFYNAKIAQVAKLADVADGTIYLYFKSKDDLLISLFEQRMDHINAQMRTAVDNGTTAPDRLRRMIAMHAALVEKDPYTAEVLTVELRQSAKFIKEYENKKFGEYLRLISSTISEGQARGELRDDIEPQLAARAIFGAIDELALQHLVSRSARKKSFDLSAAAEQLSDIFVSGLETKQKRAPQKRAQRRVP
jgi:TetR/AcrR family fatty acid metabolism transcriptional regulator